MNEKTRKIKKMSKVLNVLLKIGAGLAVAVVAGTVVAVITAPTLELANYSFVGLWRNVPLSLDVHEFRAMMIKEMLNFLVYAVILFVASFIFSDMNRESTPFAPQIANRLRVISLLLVALGIAIPPLQLLITMVFMPPAGVYVYFDFGYLVFAAVFFCMALIFEYGTELQQLSDETL